MAKQIRLYEKDPLMENGEQVTLPIPMSIDGSLSLGEGEMKIRKEVNDSVNKGKQSKLFV